MAVLRRKHCAIFQSRKRLYSGLLQLSRPEVRHSRFYLMIYRRKPAMTADKP